MNLVDSFKDEIKGNLEDRCKLFELPLDTKNIQKETVMYACDMLLEFRRQMNGVLPNSQVVYITKQVCKAIEMSFTLQDIPTFEENVQEQVSKYINLVGINNIVDMYYFRRKMKMAKYNRGIFFAEQSYFDTAKLLDEALIDIDDDYLYISTNKFRTKLRISLLEKDVLTNTYVSQYIDGEKFRIVMPSMEIATIIGASISISSMDKSGYSVHYNIV